MGFIQGIIFKQKAIRMADGCCLSIKCGKRHTWETQSLNLMSCIKCSNNLGSQSVPSRFGKHYCVFCMKHYKKKKQTFINFIFTKVKVKKLR